MAQIPYRGNLSSAIFPMSLAKAGRSVINPRVDQNFDRRVDPPGMMGDPGIPQAIYLENVLPTANGYQSVGYKPIAAGNLAAGNIVAVLKVTAPFTSVLLQESLLVFYSDGSIRWKTPLTGWSAVSISGTYSAPTPGTAMSWAIVRGVCYIHIGAELYTFNAGTLLNITATLTGITMGNVSAITGSYNYLIICKYDKVYWSSTTTPTDFVPSLVSGAGSEAVTANGTWINFARPHLSGFIIFTLTNAIFVSYTGNRSYPWKFREIQESGGFEIGTLSQNTTNNATYYGITSSGQIQAVGPDRAELIGPEVTDYLERNIVYDVFTTGTASFTQAKDTNLTQANQFQRSITFVADRYLILSYSNSQTNSSFIPRYRFAIVYDTLLRRYGKLKVDHSAIIEFEATGEILFINSSGNTVRKLYFDIYDQDLTNADTSLRYQHAGVLVLGKFQERRGTLITLEQIEVESPQAATVISPSTVVFSLKLLPSLKGKLFDAAVTPYYDATASSDNLRVYRAHTIGVNVSLLLEGAFDLNTIAMDFVSDGSM